MIKSIENILKQAEDSQLPFVIYKIPGSQNIEIQTQKIKDLISTSDFKTSGFIFAPFQYNANNVLFPNHLSDFFTFKLENNFTFNKSDENINFILNISEKEKYIQLVKKTIDYIKNGNAKKIVVSRKITLPISAGFNKKVSSFFSLCEKYPEAMVYWWQHPKVGTWMGATPEKLLSIEKNELKTMSLAGTQLYKEALNWKEKEKNEQKIVTDYIVDQLKFLCETIEIGKTHTKKAGHLAHLCTYISCKLKPSSDISEILKKIHPTPAVSGTPKQISYHYIIENEGYSRKYYTGFFGMMNKESKTELFVNLRCMEWEDNFIHLYIGGGITVDSIPENEWIETLNKTDTILSIL